MINKVTARLEAICRITEILNTLEDASEVDAVTNTLIELYSNLNEEDEDYDDDDDGEEIPTDDEEEEGEDEPISPTVIKCLKIA